MASQKVVTHSPIALSHYRKQMSLSVELLAKKSGISSVNKVIKGETQNNVFTAKQLEDIAEVLTIPTYYLSIDRIYEREIPSIVDYRNHFEDNTSEESDYQIKKVINESYVDRDNLLHIYETLDEEIDDFALRLVGNDAQEDAERIRTFLEVDNARLTVEGSDYYKSWRLLLEKKDILVLEKARFKIGSEGLSLFYNVLPIIVIFTSGQTPSRKLFTLLHELVHLGLRQSALDGYLLKADDKVERYCNEVAGHVLVPTTVINKLYINNLSLLQNIKEIRKEIKVSYDAIAIQLKQIGKITQTDLNNYFNDKQAKLDEKDSGFAPNHKKYTTYSHFGKVYLQQVFSAVWEDALSLGGAMRILGIEKMSDFEYLENKAFSK